MTLAENPFHRFPPYPIFSMDNDAGAANFLFSDKMGYFTATIFIIGVSRFPFEVVVKKHHIKGLIFERTNRGSCMAANRQFMRLQPILKKLDAVRIVIQNQNIHALTNALR